MSKQVKDVLSVDSRDDIDVTTSPHNITVSWYKVFTDLSSPIDYFQVALGTVPEGNHIVSIKFTKYYDTRL